MNQNMSVAMLFLFWEGALSIGRSMVRTIPQPSAFK